MPKMYAALPPQALVPEAMHVSCLRNNNGYFKDKLIFWRSNRKFLTSFRHAAHPNGRAGKGK
jgi:hypothetical protein